MIICVLSIILGRISVLAVERGAQKTSQDQRSEYAYHCRSDSILLFLNRRISRGRGLGSVGPEKTLGPVKGKFTIFENLFYFISTFLTCGATAPVWYRPEIPGLLERLKYKINTVWKNTAQ